MSNLAITEKKEKQHCVKSVRIRSYSGPDFPAFGLNTERYCEYEHFLRRASQANSSYLASTTYILRTYLNFLL